MSEIYKLKCLAVDDEPHALKMLKLYIEQTPFLELVKSTTSPLEALEWLKTGQPDLMFLDIQMEGLSGLQLLNIIGKRCPVILTTAYTEYALEGYAYQITDYLLKPYSFERFLKAVSQVQQSHEKPAITRQTTEDSGAEASTYLFVKGDAKHKFHQVKLADLCYIEGLRNYVQFVCLDAKIISLQNLKTLAAQLPDKRFIRIHKSYIINLDYISAVDGNSVSIKGKLIPIGSNYRQHFFAVIDQYRMG